MSPTSQVGPLSWKTFDVAWRVSAEAGRFDEAVDRFASRIVLTDEERHHVPVDARSQAFWIAGAAQLDIVEDTRNRLKRAIERGTPLATFKAEVREALTKAWGKDNPHRIETIFRNATQHAYNAGRWEQMNAPSVVRFRPFWMFDAILDGRETQICRICNGTLLSADDPWWDEHWPPQHHRCRSGVRALRRSEAERRGITIRVPEETGGEGFGLSPRLARPWRPEVERYDPQLFSELERKRQQVANDPAPPPLPASTFGPPKPGEPGSLLGPKIRIGQVDKPLSPEQQRARATAERLDRSYKARAESDYTERRTWMLWEWVNGSSRRAPALMKEAALRELPLSGVPFYGNKPYQFQPADMTRMRRDIRALYDETQTWFRRRGIRTVTLFRGVYGEPVASRNTVESWTSDERTAQSFADKGPNGRVIRVTVPVTQVLAHHKQSSTWTDGPFGEQSEYLVMW